MYENFLKFREENPLGFEEEEFCKIEKDIQNKRQGIVCDEYVEFTLWLNGLKFRKDYFSEYIEKWLPGNRYKNLLEVGSGKRAGLAILLSEKGYNVTAMDPKLEERALKGTKVAGIEKCFIYGQMDLSSYDAVIAQEPCEATEHIIRECVRQRKNFVISLCGTPHQLMSGEQLENVFQWHEYLQNIDAEHCLLLQPKLIPGYRTYVMVGIFEI